MKKYLCLFGVLIFGYLGLVGLSFSINPTTKDMPTGLLITMGIIGVIGIFATKFCWQKFRILKKKENK